MLCSKDEGQPIDDVEDEEQDGKGDQEELVNAPVLLSQLLEGDGVTSCTFLHFVFEIVLANDLDVHAVLT